MSPPLSPGEAVAAPPMPKGMHNAYVFDIFNTASWIVVLGSPMLLYLQHLRATATILAVAGSLSPLLTILQIPAARFVERVGYRRFVLSGWTTRSVLVIGMAAVAFLPESVDRATRIVLMLFLSLIYNALRGFSSCGLLPWFTHIVPEERRGEFLSRDQSAVAFAAIVSLLSYGLLFKGGHGRYAFGVVFAISAVAAFVSLFFLKRIPDVPVEKIAANAAPIPWRDMLLYPPFFRYMRFNVVINLALGASGVFWVRFMRVFLHVSDSNILLIACSSGVCVAASLFLIASLIDRAGNKQVLALAGVILAANFAGWAGVAAGIVPFNDAVLAFEIITGGSGSALWNLANVRCVMGIVPEMGRPHFLALFTVLGSLSVGLAPLVLGPIMDGLEKWQAAWGAWSWNSYSLLYCAMTSSVLVGLGLLRFVSEPAIMPWDVFMHELLVKTPSRAISRVLNRLRSPNIG
jgi:MFS family permease